MKTVTIAGPFNRKDAEETCDALGRKNHSVYGIEHKDSEGYGLDVFDYFVERHIDIIPDTIFGYEQKSFIARQYK